MPRKPLPKPVKTVGGCFFAFIAGWMILSALFVWRMNYVQHLVFCGSNEKMLGLAMVQYAQDNNERYPSGTQGGGMGWAGQLYPYDKYTEVYACPDDKTLGAKQRAVVSYGYNRNMAVHPGLGDYDDPAVTIALFEVAGVAADVTRLDEGHSQGATAFSAAGDGTDGSLVAGHAPGRRYATGRMGRRPTQTPSQEGPARHQGGANYLFADGHVKGMAAADVSSGVNAASPHAGQQGGLHGAAAGTANVSAGTAGFTGTFSVK